jgi:hypothetical protein
VAAFDIQEEFIGVTVALLHNQYKEFSLVRRRGLAGAWQERIIKVFI